MSVKERVRKIVMDASGLDAEAITDDTVLLEDLGIDSLNLLEIVLEAEKEFQVDFDVDKLVVEHDVTFKLICERIEKILGS